MNTIIEDLYWLVTKYDGTRYMLFRDEKTGEWEIGGLDRNHSHSDRVTDLTRIRNTFCSYEVEQILKEIKDKKFKVWVYDGVDYRNDNVYKKVWFVPEFKKVPVEITLKYFEPRMLE